MFENLYKKSHMHFGSEISPMKRHICVIPKKDKYYFLLNLSVNLKCFNVTNSRYRLTKNMLLFTFQERR